MPRKKRPSDEAIAEPAIVSDPAPIIDVPKKDDDPTTANPAAAMPIMASEEPSPPVMSEDRPLDRRFRRCAVDREHGYERFNDQEAGLIVIKFSEKPSPEILEQVRQAGFRYHPFYYDQQKVWTRRNDFEGRQLVGDLESAIRGASRSTGIPF
jgi:hypothetical protein